MLSWASVAGMRTATAVTVAAAREDENGDGGDPAVASIALGNAMAFSLTTGGVIGVLAWIILPDLLDTLGPDAHTLTGLAVSTIPVVMVTNLCLSIQLSLGNLKRFQIAQVISPATTLLVICLMLATGELSPPKVIVALLFGSASSLVAGCTGLPWRTITVSLSQLRADLRFGMRAHIGEFCRLANLRLDYLFLAVAASATQLGLYSTANNLLFPLFSLPATVSILLIPSVARGRKSAESVSHKIAGIRREAIRYSAFGLIAGLGLALVAPYLVPFLLGESYRDMVVLVWILLPGYVMLSTSTIISSGAAGLRRPWVGNLSEGTAMVITLTLLPLLLGPLGARGAALTSTIAYSVAAIVAWTGLGQVAKRSATANTMDPAIVGADVG
jgi:O-antigen/teichoic acid export membrane protein